VRRDKEELLKSYLEYEQSKKSIKGYDLFLIFFIFFIVLAFIFPKIYISNQIYYKSREVNRLLDYYEILKEENRLLRQKIEYQKYKNQVLGTIF
jgi:hypothetical protein